ncbi:hypothetical protein GGR02_003479 [Anoxybacillus voinovskiensis]|uniref:Uncharacterized protein n=1 Tax=Anoxybacteroides voinovskiense TaxID=230470 RepID=A0A840DVM7_9BACL|nr:hypothetical protein [Anoxybacillus voinovskiensis]MBB4075625.1 hypothetical protein [Anoxybacillus voinovskiensis]
MGYFHIRTVENGLFDAYFSIFFMQCFIIKPPFLYDRLMMK